MPLSTLPCCAVGPFLLAAALGALGCAAPAGAADLELLQDRHFRRGFTVSAPAPGRHVLAGVFRPDPQRPEPVWRICQWSSRYPFTDFTARPAADGSFTLGNAAKSVRIGRPGTPAGDLTLSLNGWLEYPDRPRRLGEPWVHLLVEQYLDREAWLPGLCALRVHFRARVDKCRLNPAMPYDPQIHAAQITAFIYIQNRNQSSAGYGDEYFFGVQVFDNRQHMPPLFVAGDPGTGKLMVCPPASAWSTAAVRDGGWVTFHGDILPEVLKGLQAAWEHGFLKDSRNLADYRPAGICVGWEVPGVFDVSCQIRDLSLVAVTR